MATAHTVTVRDWLAGQTNPDTGKPYAIANSRGRFSAAAVALVDAARAAGDTFADATPVVKVKAEKVLTNQTQALAAVPATIGGRPAPTAVVKAKAAANVKVDAKAVRAWAVTRGVAIGQRGRIHGDVIAQYLADGGRPESDKAPRATPATVAARVRVRRETTGFAFIPRPEGAGQHITQPLLRVTTCGKCSQGVAFCACKQGPTAPKHFGGAILTLDKPATVC